MRLLLLFSLAIIAALRLPAQSLSNLRLISIPVKADTVQLDTLSIAPGTFQLKSGDQFIPSDAYSLDFMNGKLIWNKTSQSYQKIKVDTAKATYRAFSFSFTKPIRHKDRSSVALSGSNSAYYQYSPMMGEPDFFRSQGLTKNGSISRGITFGNNQDVFVNSSLNLQLAGQISDNINILAAITDENIPVQPEGNTQQLQDFDRVFIQITSGKSKLIAGDFDLRRPDSYFMNFFKRGQGGFFSTETSLSENPDKKRLLRSTASLAVSRGKFARVQIQGVEGNQGPYRLQGVSGEQFIVILSGTERIYIDGQLLLRGLQNDYVIDYNTAELTFTAKRLITKDSRIFAEYEYADKNYARSLIFFNTEYETNRAKVKLNVYTEQDSKNQPLTIQLDSAKKALLASVGDSIQLAFYPNADSVGFNTNIVLYSKVDTVVNGNLFNVYRYSTNQDSAYWQVNFSDVGLNRGDYVQDISVANGRVFKWVAPLNGIPQGRYAPVSLIIAPRKQQMVTSGVDYVFDKYNSVTAEVAISNNDINLFSKKDKANDVGQAGRIIFRNQIPLSNDTLKGWKIINVLSHEYTSRHFRPLERFRNVEFERDWNLGTAKIINDENISSVQTTIAKPTVASFTYQLKSFIKGSAFDGLMNNGSTRVNWKKFVIINDISFLKTSGATIRTNFVRHNSDISRPVWRLVLGMRELGERNRFYSRETDSLTASSYAFQEIQFYMNTLDSSTSKAGLSYKKRLDWIGARNELVTLTDAQEVVFNTEFNKNPRNNFRTTTTYRNLIIRDTALTALEPNRTLLNRIDHSLSLWDGIVTAVTYYEVGTGLERRQEYYYLEVPAGQGVYAYIGDANGNGVKDLDEFAISAFTDQAKFIRVYTPTNDYIQTRSNQFSEVLTLTPAGSKSISGKPKFHHRFINQFSLRLEKKTKDEALLSSLNPFNRNLDDSTVVSTNSNFRNTLFFNRTDPVFGSDLTFLNNNAKAFLVNGFESRTLTSGTLNLRYNINRELTTNLSVETGERKNESDFLSSRNYKIINNAIEPKISFQPGNIFRLILSYKHTSKTNKLSTEEQKAVINRYLLEGKYTPVNAGIFNVKIGFVNVRYTGENDNFISYEMLEGFKNGKNITWGASLQRNIGNAMQLSFNYDGRKLQDSPTVHTGGVQFRAFF